MSSTRRPERTQLRFSLVALTFVICTL